MLNWIEKFFKNIFATVVDDKIKPVQESVKDLKNGLNRKIDDQNKKIDDLGRKIDPVIQFLMEKGLAVSLAQPGSPLQITEEGHKLLEKYKVNEVFSSCELLLEKNIKELKNQEDFRVYKKCWDWVNENAEDKILEIQYNTNFFKQPLVELLALALRDKIFKKISAQGNGLRRT